MQVIIFFHKKRFCQLLFLLFLFLNIENVFSQNKPIVETLRLEVRTDFQENLYSDTTPASGGFTGQYLNFLIDGNITDDFSFHYRQRLNVFTDNFRSFFDATDWLYLQYDINKNFSLAAGKQIVAIGGWEYDAAPIDVYYWSGFLNPIHCFQFGASASFKSNDKNHTLTAQFCNSPFISKPFDNLFAYNLYWAGNMKWFHTLYSLNFVEYRKNCFINYLSLGNKFDFGKHFFYLDFTNRATKEDPYLFKDFSVLGHLQFTIANRWAIFIKGGYDVNRTQEGVVDVDQFRDLLVTPGMEYCYFGGGLEFYPIKESKAVRLHFFSAATHQDITQLEINIGVTWKPNLLSLKK